jgi:hypothetical protein
MTNSKNISRISKIEKKQKILLGLEDAIDDIFLVKREKKQPKLFKVFLEENKL